MKFNPRVSVDSLARPMPCSRVTAKGMHKVLALIENNIATTLLLTSHLSAVGYELTLASGLPDFSERLATQQFGWVILDEAVVQPVWRRLVGVLARHRSSACLIWFGKRPRTPRLKLHAIFTKPLRYAEIARFFAEQVSPTTLLAEPLVVTQDGALEQRIRRKGRSRASRGVRR